MKRFIQIISIVLGLFCLSAVCTAAAGTFLLPDEYTILEGRELHIGTIYQISAAPRPAFSGAVDAGNTDGGYEADVSVLGVIPVKTVRVKVEDRRQVVVCGSVFGLRIYSEGVSVVDTDTVVTAYGTVDPALDAGLMKGDRITAVDGVKTDTAEQISAAIEKSGGRPVQFTVLRGDERLEITVTPQTDRDTGVYRTGLWLRDSAAGIGTLTFYDPSNGAFAGLGHSVCDADTGLLLHLRRGDILTAGVNAIKKGESGSAGELSGSFGDTILGDLYANNDRGVYGSLRARPVSYGVFPVAETDEVKLGAAEVIASIDNSGPRAYSMEIVNLDVNGSDTKNMIVKITDPALLAATGGIVQGMSGSPILQDGRLVGAITHVFLNDATRGYAIFARVMLDESDRLAAYQNAA